MKKLVTAFLIGISCAASADHCDSCRDYHRSYAKRAVKATCHLCGAEFSDTASLCWYPCEGRWLPSQYERCRKRYCPACSVPRWLEPPMRVSTSPSQREQIMQKLTRNIEQKGVELKQLTQNIALNVSRLQNESNARPNNKIKAR